MPSPDAPPRLVWLEVFVSEDEASPPLLGTGFNIEHALWSCPAFRPVFFERLLSPLQPAIVRVDTALLPAAPEELPPDQLGPDVYQSLLASAPYRESWEFLRTLHAAGLKIVLGVWGGPPQFTLDGTRLGVLDPAHYDDYVEYVVAVVDFIVRQQGVPIWAITVANEPDGGDGNRIPPDGLGYLARQLAVRLAPYNVGLYGPDTASAVHALEYLPWLLEDPLVAEAMTFVGFHAYAATPDVAAVTDYVRTRFPDLPVVVTEYTSFSFGALDEGQEASDELAFTLEVLDTSLAHYRHGAAAALYWDAVDYLQPGHRAITRWGLLRGPAEAFTPRKRYHALGQVLPYLGSGARVLEVSQTAGEEVATLAVLTPNGELAIVLLNRDAGPAEVTLQLTGERATLAGEFSAWRTDAELDAAYIGCLSTAGGHGRVTLSGYSVTTLVSSGCASGELGGA